MHCSECQMAGLNEELVQQTVQLVRDPHGSSVMQHLLEYASAECRLSIVQHLIPSVSLLAMHRTASPVILKALNCSRHARHSIIQAMLNGSATTSLVDVACSRCGSSILEELSLSNAYASEFHCQLSPALPRLVKSKFGRRVIASFKLMSPCEVASRENLAHSAAVAA